ncbi:glycosyltransferase [Croceibacterium sp. LX-88]|uniref:Glycosyltransferase n=1 Tax=Croceibacterium selenioxidans TaxID=2838833 RepID=A0ABS5W1E0_9SPHN|nr:glycosyltransferase [Croceibacterium selenioxidans]MBT2133571.1 glycosyltransferase [Croceibacterium selenioxidans]
MRSVLHVITGLRDGGAEAVLYRLCTEDRDNRHYVISLGDMGKYGPWLAKAEIPVTCLGMPPGRVTFTGMRTMWRTMRRVRPDAVQTWMYHANLLGGLIARFAGLRNISWGIHHSSLGSGEIARQTIFVARFSARLSKLIPRVIVCCAEQAYRVHAKIGYDPDRMLVIPNGYDFSTFKPDRNAGVALRAALNIASSERLIGFVARHDPLKDHANLFQALAILRDLGHRPICLLIGNGMVPDNAELMEHVSRFGLTDQVRFLGPRGDIPAVMNALDIHVMSSRGESFPNVLAEAMACGTPCVSTDVGDAATILGGTGRIVRPGDPAALARGIAEMLAECGSIPAWRARQQAARRHIAANFSLDRMLDSYRRTWFECETPRPKSPSTAEVGAV